MTIKLRFLGQNYSPSDCRVETIPSDIKAIFRGHSYPLSRPLRNYPSQFALKKYRGILYSKSN